MRAVEMGGHIQTSRSNEACVTFQHCTTVSPIVTPNCDGHNDMLFIRSIERYPQNSLLIFNRSGQEAFQTDDYYYDWYAIRHGGKPLTTGAFFYPNKVRNGRSS